MQVETNFAQGTGVQLTLKNAILLYGDNRQTVATIHDVTAEAGMIEPILSEGVPLERKAFLEVAASIAGNETEGRSRSLIGEHVLLAEPDRLCWWRPSSRRIWFWNCSNAKDKHLDALNGLEAMHPPLLFLAKEPRDLYVWALRENVRPTEKSIVYRAPYWNIWASGHLCEGMFRLPDHYGQSGIPTWEKAFFDTAFSHSAGGAGERCKYPGGVAALWKAMAAKGRKTMKVFPVECLIRETRAVQGSTRKKAVTVGQVINE